MRYLRRCRRLERCEPSPLAEAHQPAPRGRLDDGDLPLETLLQPRHHLSLRTVGKDATCKRLELRVVQLEDRLQSLEPTRLLQLLNVRDLGAQVLYRAQCVQECHIILGKDVWQQQTKGAHRLEQHLCLLSVRVDCNRCEIAHEHERVLMDRDHRAIKTAGNELHGARGAHVLAQRDRLFVVGIVGEFGKLVQRVALSLLAAAALAKHCEQRRQQSGRWRGQETQRRRCLLLPAHR